MSRHGAALSRSYKSPTQPTHKSGSCNWLGGLVMGKILFSLAFAAALLAVASSEASANFVCQAVGARSVGYGRAYFVADAKWQALIRCERRSGICIISYCVPGY